MKHEQKLGSVKSDLYFKYLEFFFAFQSYVFEHIFDYFILIYDHKRKINVGLNKNERGILSFYHEKE